MKLKIKQQIEKKDFYPKKCFLGLNEIDFSQNFGWHTEFIGYLKPLSMEEKDVFIFYLEKVTREGKLGSIHVLDSYNEEEYNMILKALTADYSIEKENIVFM